MAHARTPGVSWSKISRRALHLVGWNTLLLMAVLALIGLAGEAWFRLTTPFTGRHFPKHFVPNVGVVGKPHAEVRWTRNRDFWTVSRTNRLGFIDREPISPERAAASCHVAMIGDSFVEAKEVAIADKFHVRLEALAARALPRLDITTSAFGRGGTGQIHQLPLYDEYARHLSPKLLVLVVHSNDFLDNFTPLFALHQGLDPERIPYVTAARDEDGKIRLRPPHPDYLETGHAGGYGALESAARTLKEKVRGTSMFADWLYGKAWIAFGRRLVSKGGPVERAESLLRLPHYAPLLDGKGRLLPRLVLQSFLGESVSAEEDPPHLPPVYRDILGLMVFALEQFKMRADRDGAALAILTTHEMGRPGDGRSEWLNAVAEARGIPVISLYDHVVRRGRKVRDALWPHDKHWNPTGHRWVAEALFEWIERHRDVCDMRQPSHPGTGDSAMIPLSMPAR